ncbi:MAG: hypothetical protein Q9160_006786 [Pyrenula sp. 1 TL-2023]
MLLSSLSLPLLFFFATVTTGGPLGERDDNNEENLTEFDVAIIGGGSAGTYSAVRLHDMGKTVAVIEQKDRLGGHTETFTDPITGEKVEIGVVVWYDNDLVKAYFNRLNVPLVRASFSGGSQIPINVQTGQLISNYTPERPAAALAAYSAQLAKYPRLEDGYYLPSPVPEDLLLPFGDFVKKYDLGPAVFTIFSYNQGQGDLLNTPTLYVFKLFGAGVLNGFFNGFLATARHDNSELYRNAQAFLGRSVYLDTTVSSIDRSSSRVRLSLNTPHGRRKLIAKKLLVAVPPLVSNLAGFDLSRREKALFSQFQAHTYETGVLRNTGLPSNTTYTNVDPSRPYNLPRLPNIYGFSNTGIPNLIGVKYGGNSPESSGEARSDIINSLNRVRATEGVTGVEDAEFAVYSSHQPFQLQVSVDAIRDGFYEKLYALQGKKNTFYTGAAWQTHDSSAIWQFTESLLPKIVA